MEKSQNENSALIREEDKERLVVIDGNHLIHRAFYAIQAPLKTSDGKPTNALYGFASMLINIIEMDEPDYIAVAFDMQGPTFRHEAHDDYKGTRKKAPDELYEQIPMIHKLVEAFNIAVYKKEGYEADDMMGTLAVQAKEEGVVPYLITGDMDLLQLVDETIRVVFPHKGYREPIIYDRESVMDKYGVAPEQVVDYKAIVGDTSDNYKGVDGIGPKGAEKLLKEYGTLDNVYANINNITGSMHERLVKDKDQAFFAQHLAKILVSAPCTFNKVDTSFEALNFKAVEAYLHEMEVTSLDKRLLKITPPEKQVSEDQMSLF